MNDLEKLIYLHDPRGDAKTFLLTKAEMQEFVNAAIAVGQDGIEAKEDAAYDRGVEDANSFYEDEDSHCRECSYGKARVCYECFEE